MTVAVYHAGWFARAGLYYDLENGVLVRVPQGGGLLAGRDGAVFLRLPTMATAPAAALAAGLFRIALPLVLLGAVGFALLCVLGRGFASGWSAALRFVRLYPEPGLSYLTPCSRRCKGDWLDQLEEQLVQDRRRDVGRLAELQRLIEEQRRQGG